MYFDQQEFDIRFEWGEQGIAALAPISDVVIIVDVLSFSTCVEIAASRGATVYPCNLKHERAAAFAVDVGAQLISPRRSLTTLSLSPTSLTQLASGARIVLPSPNGSTLTMAAIKSQSPSAEIPSKSPEVLTGCLRNARAVASAAFGFGAKIAVIAAGERWWHDYSLRPSFEDMVGAGAIIRHLPGTRSPEALAAVAAFEAAAPDLAAHMHRCGSGKELIAQGFAADVDLAAQLDVSGCAPILHDGAYVAAPQAADATLGLQHGVNLLVDYDPRWPAAYAAEKQRILAVLGNLIVGIEHYGSTSVPGLRAKPIVDILVGVRTEADWIQCKSPLESLGYDYAEHAGVPNHYIFGRGRHQGERTHLVHVVEYASDTWRDSLAFRDALRADPALAAQYEAVKEQAIRQAPQGRGLYTDLKGPFVNATVAAIGGRS
jgi:2-phosphosulfolactate phosphatase